MRFFRRHQRRTTPLCIFCYHKVGTVLFSDVFEHICRSYGWKFDVLKGRQPGLPADADVVLFSHSLVDLDAITVPFRGVHLIRDPRDVIVSGYLYHRRSSEKWCVNADFQCRPPILHPQVPYSQQHRSDEWKVDYLQSLDGRSYQENLLERSQRDGLLFEMERYGTWTIESMKDWNYQRPEILEVQFEDVMGQFDATFQRIFEHFGFSTDETRLGLETAARFDLRRKSARQVGRMKHVSSPRPSKWREYLEDCHREVFVRRFDDVLVKLGYEPTNSW